MVLFVPTAGRLWCELVSQVGCSATTRQDGCLVVSAIARPLETASQSGRLVRTVSNSQRVLASPSESAPHLGAAGQDGPHDRRGLPRALQQCPHVRWQAMPFPMSLGCSPLRLNRTRLAGRRVATVSKCIGVHARPHEPAPHVGATGHEDPNVHCQPNLLPEPALSKGGGVRTVPWQFGGSPCRLTRLLAAVAPPTAGFSSSVRDSEKMPHI